MTSSANSPRLSGGPLSVTAGEGRPPIKGGCGEFFQGRVNDRSFLLESRHTIDSND